jgi:hypothetical protein
MRRPLVEQCRQFAPAFRQFCDEGGLLASIDGHFSGVPQALYEAPEDFVRDGRPEMRVPFQNPRDVARSFWRLLGGRA